MGERFKPNSDPGVATLPAEKSHPDLISPGDNQHFSQVIINMGRDGRPDGSANAVFETARDAKRVVRIFKS